MLVVFLDRLPQKESVHEHFFNVHHSVCQRSDRCGVGPPAYLSDPLDLEAEGAHPLLHAVLVAHVHVYFFVEVPLLVTSDAQAVLELENALFAFHENHLFGFLPLDAQTVVSGLEKLLAILAVRAQQTLAIVASVDQHADASRNVVFDRLVDLPAQDQLLLLFFAAQKVVQ